MRIYKIRVDVTVTNVYASAESLDDALAGIKQDCEARMPKVMTDSARYIVETTSEPLQDGDKLIAEGENKGHILRGETVLPLQDPTLQ